MVQLAVNSRQLAVFRKVLTSSISQNLLSIIRFIPTALAHLEYHSYIHKNTW